MIRSPRHSAFTLIEMITVIAIIAILAGLVLAVNGLVQKKSAMSRAEAEIRALTGALESYKTDNGGYPQDPAYTDKLDPRKSPGATDISQTGAMAQSSKFLYGALTGDTDGIGKMDGSKNYAPDFWKPARLGGNRDTNTGKVIKVLYIQDPFGNPYGYSTAGLAAEQAYRNSLASGQTGARAVAGYNPTFDMWSTAGDTSTATVNGVPNSAKWVKNW